MPEGNLALPHEEVAGPLQAFCAQLKRLQEESGLTQRALLTRAGLGRSQMSAILNGKITRLPDWNRVQAVIDACLEHATKQRRMLSADLRDARDWRRRYADLERYDTFVSQRSEPHRRGAMHRSQKGTANRSGTESQPEGATPVTPTVRSARTGEFLVDLADLLEKLDEAACRQNLPGYLPPGADVTHMARTVRLLGRVRRPPEEDRLHPDRMPADGRQSLGHDRMYALPTDHDDRADEPPQPWEQVATAHDRLIVLADPGMGKSWLVRTETHRLATAARELLAGPSAADTPIPISIRADVLAGSPGRTLAEAVSGYLTDEGLLAARSRQAMQEQIARGGVVLLIDALDEVPRDASAARAQAPRKRLEDLLRQWVGHCTGRARCVLTTRLAGYSGPPMPGADEAELLPFTADDARAVARAWNLPPDVVDRVDDLLRDPAMAGIARVPLLLALICSLAASLPKSMPTSRAGLYEDVVWRFLSAAHRAADHGAPAPTVSDIERQRLLEILTHVAVTFASTSRGWVDLMTYQELTAAIRGAGGALADLGGSASAVLSTLVDRAGVLVPAGNPAIREPGYMFLHRTVGEYLAARRMRDLPPAERMQMVQEHQWFDPDWAEVMPILGGLLARKDPDQARDLVAFFLTRQRDPLHRAFLATLRILGESPDIEGFLTPAQVHWLGQKTTRLLASGSTRADLLRVLAAAPRWPRAVTTAVLAGLDASDQHVRWAAIDVLVKNSEPTVTDALIGRLTDKSGVVRNAAVQALAGRNDEEVISGLLARMTDPDRNVRHSTVEVLAGHDQPAATDALITMLTDGDESVRHFASTMLARRRDPVAAKALASHLTSDVARGQPDTDGSPPKLDEPGVTDTLLGLLNDPRRNVRYTAALALRLRDDPRITAAMLALLEDKDPLVQLAAERTLASRDEPAVTDALLGLLDRSNWKVRHTVAAMLDGRDDPRVASAMLTLLDDEDSLIRRAAVGILAKRDEPAVAGALLAWHTGNNRHPESKPDTPAAENGQPTMTDALLHLLHNDDSAIRRTAAECLAGRDSPTVIKALITRLGDSDRYVRQAAVDAMAERDDPAVTAALLAMLKNRRGAPLHRTARKALAGRDWAGLLAAVFGEWPDESVRLSAIKALAWRAGGDITSTLLTQLGSGNARLADAAAEALAVRDDPAILIWLCRRNLRAPPPHRKKMAFCLASRIVDRVYPLLRPEAKPWIRRRLYQLTRSV
jgi:HEAT repeat protein/transcriptional regulator with XRE-family HTH domain